jgi:hypothetical protein
MDTSIPLRRRSGAPGATVLTLIMSAAALAAGVEMTLPQEQLPALQEAPLKQYRAFRQMHAKNAKFNQEAWIEAWTELDGTTFRYEITSERGTDYIKDKVLKALLAREQELVSKGESGRAEISAENYLFEESAQEPGFRYVQLKPKRKDMLLVNGRMVLNSEGTELLRVEGTLAKNPSFWTSTVNIVREFAMLDGVRVPVSTETVAKLKFAGQAHMEVRYQYETVNGRRVDVASAHGTASLDPSRPIVQQTARALGTAGSARASVREH